MTGSRADMASVAAGLSNPRVSWQVTLSGATAGYTCRKIEDEGELSNGLEVSKHMLFLLFILTNFQIQCIEEGT